jgi:hypothetical protein
MFPECANPGLISLVDRAKHAKPDILGAAIRKNWELVEEARRLRIPWGEIAEALGFQGKGPLARASYSRERRRLEKKGGVKTAPAQKIENEKQKNESAGKRTVHMIRDADENKENLFERSKLY